MQIRKISLSRLVKSEMTLIMDNVIDIVQECDYEKLHLGFMLEILKKNRLELDAILELYGAEPLTPQVQKWHEKRMALAGSISTQVQGIAQANLDHLKEETKIAKDVVKHCLIGLRKKNKGDVEGMISDFLVTVMNNPDVNDAFTKLGLMRYIDELDIANETHYSLDTERRSNASKRQRGDDNKALMRESQIAMRTLFEQIDLASRTYPELNYEPLIRHLNEALARFTNLIKTRDTYNKKRALKAKQAKEAAAKANPKTDTQLMRVDKKPTGLMVVKKKEEEKTLGKDEKKMDGKKGDGKSIDGEKKE